MISKNYFLLAIGFTLLVIMGCKHEDARTKMLVKKWAYQEFKMNDEAMSGEDLGNPTMEFMADGKYKVEFGPMSEEGDWQLKGDELKTKSKTQEQTNTLKILSLEENKLVFSGDAEGNTVTITLVPFKE